MNLFGVLIDELGLSPGLIDPLVQDWLAPLCSAIPSFAEAGAATISHHKPFVVAYHEGEDKGAGLKVHTDNAEFTLNASLGPRCPRQEASRSRMASLLSTARRRAENQGSGVLSRMDR